MSSHFPKFSLLVLAATLASAQAFSPPVDKQDGITLRIDGFVDHSSPNGSAVSKIHTDKPLPLTVVVVNDSSQIVSGQVRVWLNDDWSVIDPASLAVQVEPGKTWRQVFTAQAAPSVLNALYPVHAELVRADHSSPLHAIAVFEAVKPIVPSRPAPPLTPKIETGVFRLTADSNWRVFYRQTNGVVALGPEFSGYDETSGTVMSRSSLTRNGITRDGFIAHPPYRDVPGVTWTDFRLVLPDHQPIRFDFNTAIRDNTASEPPSDGTESKVFVIESNGTEHEVFSRFSASKKWVPATVDLSAFAGSTLTLRLWTGPGPANDPTCDQCYWGSPAITVGKTPALQSEAEWQSLDAAAITLARQAICAPSASGPGQFRLTSGQNVFGAGIALGRQGLTDGVIAFSDGQRDLVIRGFACDIDDQPIGGVENSEPILKIETAYEKGVWILSHQLSHRRAGSGTKPVTARARIWTEGGALRLAWDLPDAAPDSRGNPRYTRLGLGTAQLPVWRAYAGFGNVIENPGPFTIYSTGFTLSTRHVGADYPNGLSLVQASDIFPDRLTYSPESRRFALEAHHNVSFFFVPSTNGAFAAAREYSARCGFQKGPGVDKLAGRICLDQWGGGYPEATRDIQEAARYGVTHAVFVKHDWQRWGYDYRLPDIFPPAGGLEPFLAMRRAAQDAGMLFCPHDNYIDFYPDARNFSYDSVVFDKNGQPVPAWYNKGRGAQSYRWLPQAFMPWLKENMRQLRSGFAPDSLFIDVFSAIAPFDAYDRAGVFHPLTQTVTEWRNAFDTCRALLGNQAPMISEAGTDALIGSLDAGEADHFPARRWIPLFGDAERTPWHDMATHGKMILFAGGLGSRYSARDWDKDDQPGHGYGSDDYLSNTVIGGRNPMCDGPFSRRAVMTYWLLHDVCRALAQRPFETLQFADTIHQQHTTFGNEGRVWVNRRTNLVWRVADAWLLPEYGFYAQTPEAEAGIVMLDGQRAAFARSADTFFADARPPHNTVINLQAESSTSAVRYVGEGVFDATFNWKVLLPNFTGYVPFLHLCNEDLKGREDEHIVFQAPMEFDLALLQRRGEFTATARITVPRETPAGDYSIRYGLYDPISGKRLVIGGIIDENSRVRGGILRIEKEANRITAGTFIAQDQATEAQKQGSNLASRMLDFGPLVTDGAFRLVHSGTHDWQLIPLPGSRAFRAEIRLDKLANGQAKVKTIEAISPVDETGDLPQWTQEGSRLRLTAEARSFGYRIVFE